MGSYQTGLTLAEKIAAGGVAATCDPRSAVPPCVLIEPPRVTYDTMCGGTGHFQLWALASGTANADMWQQLDELAGVVADVLPVQEHSFVSYRMTPDAPALPAYLFTLTQGVDLP